MKCHQKQHEWDEQARGGEDQYRQVCRTVDKNEFAEVIQDIKLKLKLGEGVENMLDVGCGNGFMLSFLKNYARILSGVDFSEVMIDEVSKSLEGVFKVGEANKLDFEDNQFDRVMSYSIFHYFPNLDYGYSAIQEMIRVCKKGGVVLVGDLLDEQFENEIKGASNLSYEKEIPSIQRYSEWQFFDLNKLKLDFIEMGFKVEILPQPETFKCGYYRKDLRIFL